MSLKNILWLASYPKSGNTWTRIFLANYLFAREEPMPINQVHRVGMGDAIAKTYRAVARRPIDTGDHKGMLALRPAVLRAIANNKADINFVKTHNIRDKAMAVELIPPHLTRGAVYILRNPLDLVLSYARHYAMDLPATVAAIGRTDNVVMGDATSVPQYLGNWSKHVRSWTKNAPFPVLTLRYEDMQTDPGAAFTKLLKHIGMVPEPERLARAIRFSSFDEVAKQETEHGFIEKSPTAEKFFHSGKAGQWKEKLDPALIERIETEHGPMMRKYGYL